MGVLYEFGCNFEIFLRQVNKSNFLNVVSKQFLISLSDVKVPNVGYCQEGLTHPIFMAAILNTRPEDH